MAIEILNASSGTAIGSSNISTTDIIQMGDRRFEILTIENIDESNELLEIHCIEILNA